jgi:hypothetical protein
MKFSNFVNEERLHSKDKRVIMSFINEPPTSKKPFKLETGQIVKVEPTTGGVKFTFDKDDFEVATTIVDIVDAMGGYKFKAKPDNIIVMTKGK